MSCIKESSYIEIDGEEKVYNVFCEDFYPITVDDAHLLLIFVV